MIRYYRGSAGANYQLPEVGQVVVKHDGTDLFLAESIEFPGSLALHGACEEFLYYVGSQDLGFFQSVVKELTRRRDLEALFDLGAIPIEGLLAQRGEE